MAIYLQPFDRFGWNLARWRTVAPPLKFWIFENPRWRRPPSWKSQKSRYLRNGLTDLYDIWYADAKWDSKPPWPLKNLNFTNPRWRTAAILRTVKLSYLCKLLTDFDEIWHDDAHLPLTADGPLKFRIYDNPRPRKYTTRVDPHVDNSYQVWSWYYHPLSGITMGWLLRLVTGGPLVVRGPDSSILF